MKRPLLLLILLVLPIGSLPTSAAINLQDDAIPVIISTDTSTGLQNGWRSGVSDIDDGLALAMALDAPELDVRGVIVTWGNNLMEPEFAVASRVVSGMEANVPVVRGASRKLPAVPVLDHNGAAVDSACLNQGVDYIAAALAASEEPITLIAIGPLTDYACLALNYPAALANIERVIALMGRGPDEAFEINGHFLSDFNLAIDAQAAQYFINNTSLPFTFMAFSLTRSSLVPSSDRQILCDSALVLAAEFFCPAILPWLTQWNGIFAEDGFHPWDQNTLYKLIHPEAFDCEPATYQFVDCTAGPCAGHDPSDPSRLASEAVQLWLAPTEARTRIEVCTAYAPGGKEAFLDAIFAFAQ